jgi:glycogen synthase
VKILVLTNLFPPHHAGTYDFRCQSVVDRLRKRGHDIRVLTSSHGMSSEERDPEIERRLRLRGVYGHAEPDGLNELRALEQHNHQVLREALADFKPELIYVWSLHGLSKSLIFSVQHSRLPVVFDVADYWLSQGLREDAWLAWWNRTSLPFSQNLKRSSLEVSGMRSRWDVEAPTRANAGMQRMPDVFDVDPAQHQLAANSVTSFAFDRIYFCSYALKETSMRAGFRVDQAEVIHPGIRSEQFVDEVKPASAPVRKFLLVSPLNAESGVMTVLQALRHARSIPLDLSLSLYGRGESDYVAKLRSLAVQEQLPVEFLTMANLSQDLPAIYRQHDAFLYSAEWEEPFSLRILEAMVCGRPIIGTKRGGARELLNHGQNALTYTAGDAHELLARIQELQTQPDLRVQLAESAQAEAMNQYNETAVIDRIEDYLQKTCALSACQL